MASKVGEVTNGTTTPNKKQFVNLETKKDSFVNLLTGLGDPNRDKRKSTVYIQDELLDVDTLEALYHGNDLAARICNLLPDDAFRQGYRVKAGGDDQSLYSDQISALLKQGRELCVDDKNHTANVWANVFGAGVLFLGAVDGLEPHEPLDETKIQSFRFLTVIERRDLTPHTWYSDPLSASYGKPATYKLNSIQVGNTYNYSNELYNSEIHESRLVIYPGTLTSRNMMVRNDGWPLSLLQRCSQVLFDFNTSWEFMSVLLQDVSQGIFKLDGLIEMIAEGEEQRLQQRMLITDMSRSVGNSIMLDAEREDFRRETVNLGGIPDILKEFQKRVSAAAGEPASLLFGVSPSGLGSTLDADIRWHYDKVKAHQENIIRPRLERQYRLMMLAKDGPTGGKEIPDFTIEFEPLWQMSDKEDAELRKLQADSDVLYINSGVLLPEEVTLSRFRPEGYSIETSVDLALRRSELGQPASFKAPQEDNESLPTKPVVPTPAVKETTQPVATQPVIEAKEVLNGAQVSSILDVLKSVSNGDLPRESAQVLFQAAFGLSEETAQLMLGTLGTPDQLREKQKLLESVPVQPSQGGEIP